MSATAVWAIAIGWTIMSVGVAFLVVRGVVESTWKRLAAAHPAVEPAPDAVRRRFQSFKMNLLNLGLSVHVAADERYLHLSPAAVIRWAGARPMSIPWESIEVLGHGITSRSVRTRIDGITVWGPAWCLRLAERSA
jgi:hypothetical protein